jgi:hypothetical protein
VPALQAAEGADIQIVDAWKLVEVHPKVASLLLKGKTVREAFFLARRITAAIEPTHRPGLRVLENFIRCAVTSTAGANPNSALATTWSRFDQSQLEQLEIWFCKVLGKVPMITPPLPPAGPPPMPPLPPQALENPELLVAVLTSYAQARENPVGRPYTPHELVPLLLYCGNQPSV